MSALVLEMRRQSIAEPLPVDGFTEAVLRAVARLGLSEKELAALFGTSPAQWSKQKRGVDGHGMRVQRFDQLPEQYHELFLAALLEELARLCGRTVVQPGGHLAQLVKVMRGISDTLEQMAVQPGMLPLDRAVAR